MIGRRRRYLFVLVGLVLLGYGLNHWRGVGAPVRPAGILPPVPETATGSVGLICAQDAASIAGLGPRLGEKARMRQHSPIDLLEYWENDGGELDTMAEASVQVGFPPDADDPLAMNPDLFEQEFMEVGEPLDADDPLAMNPDLFEQERMEVGEPLDADDPRAMNPDLF